MKKNIILALLIVFVSALVMSCSVDPVAGEGAKSPVLITMKDLRGRMVSSASTWQDGDTIGVMMVPTGDALAVQLDGSNTYQFETDSTTNSGTFTQTGLPATLYWPADGSAVDFYAFYPYVSSGILVGNLLPVDVSGDQTDMLTGIDGNNLDILWGNVKNKTKPAEGGSLSMTMEHVMSRVVVKVKLGPDMTTMTAQQIEDMTLSLNGMDTAGTVDLGNDGTATPTDTGDVIPARIETSSTDEAAGVKATFEAVVYPNADARFTTVFTVGEREYTWDNLLPEEEEGDATGIISEVEDPPTVSFAAGQQTILTMTLNNTEIGFDVSVVDWEEVDGGDVIATN